MSIFVILCVFVVLIALVLLRLFKKPRVQEQYKVTQDIDPYKISINEIDRMEDGKDFEMYLFRLFQCLGYGDAYKTQDSRDFGADLVFTDREGYRNVIQAKRYAVSNPVGLSAVQEVYSSMRFYRAKKSTVITSSKYTISCEQLASFNRVKLLDRNDLIEMIELFKSQQHSKVKDIIEAEPYLSLDSWDDYRNKDKIIKKDHKSERRIASGN
ncbi:restriction endonuclease [Paenibacillus polymyxa]|uniref:Restriction endonuclease n=1 Tax=Paenibacillus polymyxa TaxID=1406 RepID=A0A8I1ILF6_PAEPO|nr:MULTISPECIES: restriction endonuclease [Paenibacillus]KAF6576871.1 restriction endonuclease [Paenibacillus sp. EKM206P]KAF6590942.1 restriction endonuclease [Paenibacillus sp. EKM205P]MBM0631666.1 restriction endonuclease [Paenibacillus polymyxa]